tara:strand:- start:129 stop:515 length:387 start_codon:yes stop_codon:yes gene_type:complete
MLYNTKKLILSAVILLALDSIYLSKVSSFFNTLVKDIQGSKINLHMGSAIFCYFFIILGLNYLVIQKNNNLTDAFILGLTTYGIFEATNMAIFDKWTLSGYTLLDIVWGGVLYATTTYLTDKASTFLF